MKQEPTKEELDQIAYSVAAGDRIEAINLYISIAGCGLTEAQRFVREIPEELKSARHGHFSHRKSTQRLFGKF